MELDIDYIFQLRWVMQVKRKQLTDNERTILFCEVDGMCPLCIEPLMYEKQERNYSKFEGAHIYPLSPSEEEIELLKNEERLSDDVNDLKNYIALCADCHTKFDKPRTVLEYRQLFAIKSEIIARNQSQKLFFKHHIETEIKSIILQLAENCDDETVKTPLSLEAIEVNKKANETLTKLSKKRIRDDIAEYFLYLKEQFAELEKTKQGSFELIATEIKVFYLSLKRTGVSQEQIYKYVSEWISRRSDNSSIEACKIITSFFVQNCEVFS